jgi:hypothetical protein
LYVNVDNPQRYTMALRERLADMAYYIAYSLRSLRTAYLSIMAYFTDEYSGTIIPSRVLETIHTLDQEALAWILHVPDLRLMDRLSAYMQSTSPSVLKANSSEILATATKTVMSSTRSPEFWSSPHVQAEHKPNMALHL